MNAIVTSTVRRGRSLSEPVGKSLSSSAEVSIVLPPESTFIPRECLARALPVGWQFTTTAIPPLRMVSEVPSLGDSSVAWWRLVRCLSYYRRVMRSDGMCYDQTGYKLSLYEKDRLQLQRR